jgi:hypothetical protein
MAMRSCNTEDDRLFAFVDGVEASLDEHVAECDECQSFLAELWVGELRRDLTDPVLRQIKFEKFLADVARLGLNIASGMARAAVEYTVGHVDREEPTA